MIRSRIPAISTAILGAAIVSLLALAPASASPRDASAHARAAAAGPAQIKTRHTSLGTVLVNGKGFTVYVFSRDSKRKDRCMSISGCPGTWPVVRTHGRPRAGHGVKRSQLGTIRIHGGASQVTYAGHPLYTYSGDVSPGSTDYVGAKQFGGTWRAIKPSGALVG